MEELVQLCWDSEKLVTSAVQGTYKNPPGKSFFPLRVDRHGTPPQNLRARAVEENKRFAEAIQMQGQKLRSSPERDSQIIQGGKLNSVTKEDFARTVVEPLLQQNTGTEFQLDHNPTLVYKLFQSYSESWSRIAQGHKDNLGIICNEFLGEVIDYIWPPQMHNTLCTQFLNSQMKNITKGAQEQVDLLRIDLDFEVRSYDPEYEDRLKRWRAGNPAEGAPTEAEEELAKMLIYYEVCCSTSRYVPLCTNSFQLTAKTFISNVITQVVERHMLQGLVSVFSWVNISRMDEAFFEAITEEDKATRERRRTLEAKKTAIDEAADLCAALAMRKELRTVSLISLLLHVQNDNSDGAIFSTTRLIQTAQKRAPTMVNQA